MSSSPRITRTVSGRMSSSRSTSFTRRPPATSTSRRGFRKMTFTGSPRASRCGVPLPSRLREPPRALHVADLREMDPVVPGLKLPPLREVEIAEAKVVEAQRAWIHRPELLHGLSAPLSRGPHGRDQLADRFTRRRPHHLRRVRRPRRIGRERRERREVGRPRRERPPSRGLPRELRGELARRDLGERQMVDDLADRPNLRARFPVRLALGEPLHFSEDLGAHGLELVPQSLHGLRKAHRGTRGQYNTPGRSGYFADARTIGPVGAGTPPSGSSVTAKTFTGLPPSTGSTRCVAPEDARGPRRPLPDRPQLVRLARRRRRQVRDEELATHRLVPDHPPRSPGARAQTPERHHPRRRVAQKVRSAPVD